MSGSGLVHANAVLVGETGLLLRGPSGCGKSASSLALIEQARERGEFAALIGDDRVFLETRGERLIVRSHPALAGRIEIRNLGIMQIVHEPAAVIRGVVDLLAADAALPKRYPEERERHTVICGVSLPRLVALGGSDALVRKIFVFLREVTSK